MNIPIEALVHLGGSSPQFMLHLTDDQQKKLRRFIHKRVLNPEDADDLLQLTYLEAWRNRERFSGTATLSTWMCGIAQNLIRNLRAAKQPEELAMMYQAQQITDEAFAQICTVIRPGMTEREIAAELIYRMLRLGAEGTSFDPIVLTGPDTSMPPGVPGDRRVAAGDFVTMDFGCRKNGYCSDMTRTVAVGMPSDEMRSVYQIVLNAQLAGIAAAKAGVTGERVDAAARKVISDAGYGAYFGHSFGHSLGLDIHEHPIAAPGVHAKLPEHTVISAEPGIYLPGKFGVRIEDVMHLTADGAEILTRSPKNLIIL